MDEFGCELVYVTSIGKYVVSSFVFAVFVLMSCVRADVGNNEAYKLLRFD